MKYLKTYETNYKPFGKFKVGDIVNYSYSDTYGDYNLICIISDYNHLYVGYNRRNEPIKNCIACQPITLKTIKNDEIEIFAYTDENHIEYISSIRTVKSLEPLTKEEEEEFKLNFDYIVNSFKYNI